MAFGPSFDIDRLRLPASLPLAASSRPTRPPRHKPGEKFLKGPIPWNWLVVAAQQRGKALHVAMEIWRYAGMKRRATVPLNLTRAARELGTSRSSVSRGLRALENAELVSVRRESGQKTLVTLLELDAQPRIVDGTAGVKPYLKASGVTNEAGLEGAGLVSVIRHVGRKPLVTLLDVRRHRDIAESYNGITASAEPSTISQEVIHHENDKTAPSTKRS